MTKIVFRNDVHLEQDGLCAYCYQPMIIYAPNGGKLFQNTSTMDHKIPRKRGGTNKRENIAGACSKCNSKKGILTVEEYAAVGERFGFGALPKFSDAWFAYTWVVSRIGLEDPLTRFLTESLKGAPMAIQGRNYGFPGPCDANKPNVRWTRKMKRRQLEVHTVALIIAEMEDSHEVFVQERGMELKADGNTGTYAKYVAEAEQLVARLRTRGFKLERMNPYKVEDDDETGDQTV